MATRAPLVIITGQVQQIPAGDTLAVAITGAQQLSITNDDIAIIAGAVVYLDAASGVKKAQANAAGTAKPIGLALAAIAGGATGVIATDGVLTLTTGQWDAVFGTTGGLAFNTLYFLSAATASFGTATAPTTVGQYVVELGLGISTTDLAVRIRSSILL